MMTDTKSWAPSHLMTCSWTTVEEAPSEANHRSLPLETYEAQHRKSSQLHDASCPSPQETWAKELRQLRHQDPRAKKALNDACSFWLRVSQRIPLQSHGIRIPN